MPKGILLVQSRPSSPAEADTFHRWYDETHIPELLAVDGFSSARRMQAEDGESFLVVYEVDDIDGAKAAMASARKAGAMSPPQGLQLDPPPTVQWFTDLGDDGT
jgi:hypothetical protein